MPEIKCPCGTIVSFTNPSRVGRKKFCSKVCFYRHRVRPSGLTYKLVKENPTSFKKGYKPWNKGVYFGENHPSWKGDDVGYEALHEWVEKQLGKERCCDFCGTTTAKKYDWSNRSGMYRRDLSDWQRLCVKCHFHYDKEYFGVRENFHR